MTTPTLDGAMVRRVVGLDPALAALPAALDSARIRDWSLHDVRWTPGVGARLALEGGEGQAGAPETFVGLDVAGEGWTQYDLRDDPRLPHLRSAADAAGVAARLSSGSEAPVVRVRPIRYRPGSRCVLEYEVADAGQTTKLYAKAVAREVYPSIIAVAAALGGATVSARPGAVSARVVASWSDIAVLVTAAVPGRSASSVLGDASLPVAERIEQAVRLGGLLAQFHARRVADAGRFTPFDALTTLDGAMPAVQLADPPAAARARRLLQRLATMVPGGARPVLTHGAFRAGQVVAADRRSIVLDLDTVAWSDRERDLGSALAHLAWHGIRQSEHRAAMVDAGQALLTAYECEAGSVATPRLAWWRTLQLLQLAVRRYRRLELDAWPLVPELLAMAEALAGRPVPGSRDQLRERGADAIDAAIGMVPSPDGLHPRTSARTIAVAPGRRTVVRYEIDHGDGAAPVAVLAKSFSEPRRASLLHEHLRLLHGGPLGSGDLRVPEPLAFDPAQRLVVFRALTGVPLDAVCDPATQAGGVRDAARWLARLHGSEVVLPRSLSVLDEMDSARRWAARIGRFHPPVRRGAQQLATSWARSIGPSDRQPLVPIHKDLHPGHVIVGETLGVIDLDEARMGDPSLDVAHFCAYLEAMFGPRGIDLAGSFLVGYAEATGWTDRGTFAPWSAYAWLKIARQWATGARPFDAGATERRATEIERAISRGRAWLAG